MELQWLEPHGGLPWDPSGPLVHHVLNTLDTGACGAQQFAELRRTGANLTPSASRGAASRWSVAPKSQGFILPVDVEAGDGRLLFFSVGRPHRSMFSLGRPALAFRLRDLPGKVGWRFRDFAALYTALAGRGLESLLARCADQFTLWDRAAVERLASIECALLEGSMADRKLRAEATRLMREAITKVSGRALTKGLLPRLPRGRAPRFASPAQTEVVLEGEVPLDRAVAWYDPSIHRWRPCARLDEEHL